MCTMRDTSKERYPGEYYGQREVDEATAALRAKRGDVSDVHAGESEGLDIPYPLCQECGKRHPHLDWLMENGKGICELCGRVDDLPKEPAFEPDESHLRGLKPGKVDRKRASPPFVPNEWTDENGHSRFVDYLPLHKNERGQWCKRPIRVLRNASAH